MVGNNNNHTEGEQVDERRRGVLKRREDGSIFSRRRLLGSIAGAGITGASFNAVTGRVTASSQSESDKRDKVPSGADGGSSILIQNDVYQIDLGETESGFWIWPVEIDNHRTTTLFHELFALQAGDGDVILSYNPTEIVDRFPDNGQPGETYSCVIRYEVGGTELLVKRTVRMDESEPTFTLKYDIRNVGTETIDELNFYEHADFDNGSNDFFDDVGFYQASPEYVYTTDEGEYGGFSGNQLSENHHVGEYPAYDELRNGNLNNQDKFPETGSDDPVCILQWDLGTLEPDGTTSITLQYGGAFSQERLERNVEEPDEIETEPPATPEPKLISHDLPPTAVEVDKTAPFGVTVDPGSATPDDVSVDAVVDISRRGTKIGSINPDVTSTVTDGNVRVTGDIPSAKTQTDQPAGVGFSLLVKVSVEEKELGLITAETYAFRDVDRVFGVAAKPSNTTPVRTGTNLSNRLRAKAEYVNRYYTSELGSMGAKGFDFEFLNARDNDALDDDGWLPLEDGFNAYDDGGGNSNPNNSVDFVSEAFTAADDAGVDFSAYDTAIATNGTYANRNRYIFSRSFWQGNPLPEVTVPVLNKTVDLSEPTDLTPFSVPTGEIDGIYAPIDVDTWLHEFGHGLGPGLRVGFPDLYEIDAPFQNFGNIADWGLMGGRQGKVINSFCRTLGSDAINPSNTWLNPSPNAHVIENLKVDLPALTDLELGDDAKYIVSAFAFISLEWDGLNTRLEVDPQLGLFLLEGRRGGTSRLVSPAGFQPLLSPDPFAEDGVALYRFGLLSIDGSINDLKSILEDILNRETPQLLENLDAELVDIDYVPPNVNDENRVTFASQGDTYYDNGAATTFELTDDLNNSPASVELQRDTGALGDAYSIIVNLLSSLQDFVQKHTSGPGIDLPPPDVVAETPDGRRVGVDPETGEVVNEVEGARVFGTTSSRGIRLPSEVDANVTVSDTRLKHTLEEAGVDPPDEIKYERTTFVDHDLTIEEREGVAFLDGRIALTEDASTGTDAPVIRSVALDLDPDRLNTDSEGEFVTSYIGFEKDVNVSKLQLGSIVLAGVPAVSDDQYGFVRNPPVEERDGRKYVMVKFRQNAVIKALGTGDHLPPIFGAIGDSLFHGTGRITVFKPSSENEKGED